MVREDNSATLIFFSENPYPYQYYFILAKRIMKKINNIIIFMNGALLLFKRNRMYRKKDFLKISNLKY